MNDNKKRKRLKKNYLKDKKLKDAYDIIERCRNRGKRLLAEWEYANENSSKCSFGNYATALWWVRYGEYDSRSS